MVHVTQGSIQEPLSIFSNRETRKRISHEVQQNAVRSPAPGEKYPHASEQGVGKLESSFAELALCVWWTPNCPWASNTLAKQPNGILSCVRKTLTSILSMCINTWREEIKQMNPNSLVVSTGRMRVNGHKMKQEILFEHMKKLLQCKGDRTQKLAAQRGSAVFMSRYTPNLT